MNIPKWLAKKFPSAFIFSVEVNKDLYTNKDQLKSIKKKVDKLAKDMPEMFDIEEEDESH